MNTITRRELLARLGLTAAAVSLSHTAHAIGEPPVSAARLVLPGLDDPRPGALEAILREVAENSSVDPLLEIPSVDPESDLIFSWPFLSLIGDRGFDPMSETAVANLRLYLREGGFLFIDDATGVRDSDFDRSVRRDLARILPGSKVARIGREHAIYRSFFLMRGAVGRIMVRPYLEGLWVGDITPVLYSSNDLSGAWLRAADGRYALEVIPGGESQRKEARKLGVNLVLFALTSNYKRDAVHVRTLLKRMRRQGGYAE